GPAGRGDRHHDGLVGPAGDRRRAHGRRPARAAARRHRLRHGGAARLDPGHRGLGGGRRLRRGGARVSPRRRTVPARLPLYPGVAAGVVLGVAVFLPWYAVNIAPPFSATTASGWDATVFARLAMM